MGVAEDAATVLVALVKYKQGESDSKVGRYSLEGADLFKETGLSPDRLNDAVQVLEGHGYVEVETFLGCAPFSFSYVHLSAQGRLEAERMLTPVEDESSDSTAISEKEPDAVAENKPDPKKVFIIHGRNIEAKNAVEHFVRSLKLEPVEFDELAADLGAAFVGEIVREGMKQAQGIIALFTADELAFLRPDYHQSHDSDEDKERWQSRPNVIFEAGMAYGTAPERTVLAVLGGEAKLFSDVRGIHLTYLGNSTDARKRLRQKLIGAGCDVDERADAWTDPKRSGDFESCVLPGVSTASPFRQ
ncbi:MAG: nucleotide-binding protein [Myxococcales bacterium]|nr:nucleotide-binding protein [Myxococcales bacterium]